MCNPSTDLHVCGNPQVAGLLPADGALLRASPLPCRLRRQRATEIDCSAAAAIASARTLFRRRGASVTLAGGPLPGAASGAGGSASASRRLRGVGQQQEQAGRGYARLHQECFLLARKFAPDTVQVRVGACLLLPSRSSPGVALQGRPLHGRQLHLSHAWPPQISVNCLLKPCLQLLLHLSEDCQEGTALSPKCLDG